MAKELILVRVRFSGGGKASGASRGGGASSESDEEKKEKKEKRRKMLRQKRDQRTAVAAVQALGKGNVTGAGLLALGRLGKVGVAVATGVVAAERGTAFIAARGPAVSTAVGRMMGANMGPGSAGFKSAQEINSAVINARQDIWAVGQQMVNWIRDRAARVGLVDFGTIESSIRRFGGEVPLSTPVPPPDALAGSDQISQATNMIAREQGKLRDVMAARHAATRFGPNRNAAGIVTPQQQQIPGRVEGRMNTPRRMGVAQLERKLRGDG